MKILLSWIDLTTDMNRDEKTGDFSGPTLEAVRQDRYDRFYLFANSTETFEKASLLKRYVEDNRKLFSVKKVITKFIQISNPTDYQELWGKVPMEIETIAKKVENQKPEFFINLSAGTPAMRTTWLMMVGSGQLKATALNVQRISPTEPTTIEKVDVGIYPFVSRLQRSVDRQLGIPQMFESPQMQLLMRKLAVITGDLNMPILLLGETGTGKTTIAQMYHLMTGSPKEKFFHFVCGEFDVGDLNTIKSHLFGHTKGSFTGAESDQDGVLLKADGGTVFLDEIGDIPPRVQRLLINAVEKKEFRPMGSNDLIQSNFRLICATNRDIKEMLKNNELSQDFYNRIRSCEYLVPPLRERKEDIPAIFARLLQTEANYNSLKFEKGAKELLMNRLKAMSLPGNIRDIQQILDHLTIQSNQPKRHSVTAEEINNYLEKLPEPSQNDEFVDLVHRMLNIWPDTTYACKGYKWQEALIEVALEKLKRNSFFKKKTGGLNVNKMSNFLGIDNKTIKTRLEAIESVEQLKTDTQTIK